MIHGYDIHNRSCGAQLIRQDLPSHAGAWDQNPLILQAVTDQRLNNAFGLVFGRNQVGLQTILS